MTELRNRPIAEADAYRAGEAAGLQKGFARGLGAAADYVDCGCTPVRRTAVREAVARHGRNSDARWAACGENECACLMADEVRGLADLAMETRE